MTPRGIEILVKKASVDGAFRRHLLAERSGAAARIGLEMDPAEAAMLDAIPEAQLVAIIEKTRVVPLLRPAFMGYAAAAMLAALGVAVGCGTPGEEATPEETALPVVEPPAETGEKTLDTLGIESGDTTDGLGISGEGVGSGGFGEVPGGGSGTYKGTGATGIRPDTDFVSKNNKGEKTVNTSFSINSVVGPGELDLSRSHAAISAKINARKSGIFYLFRKEMKEYPEMPGGKIVYEFTILANGSVSDVEVLDDGMMNTSLTVDIASRISSWRFSPASDEVTVVVPFVFVVTG